MMLRTFTSIAVAIAALIAVPLPVGAQPDDQQGQRPTYQQQPAYSQDRGAQQPSDQQRMAEQKLGHLAKASELLGMQVRNQQDEEIGEIQDIALNPAQQNAPFAVLSFGGFLGVGDKWFAIPWDAFHKDPSGEYLVLPIPKERLQQAQGFDKDQWPDLADPSWAQQARQTLGLPARSDAHRAPGQAGMAQDPQPQQAADQAQMGQRSPAAQPAGQTGSQAVGSIARATQVIGRNVHSASGGQIGDVNDLLIDMRSSHLVYAVLSYGGTLGFGNKLAIVPWSAIRWAPADQALTLNADKQVLDQVSFEKDNWPDLTDQSYATRLHQHFNQQPYWQVYGFGFYGAETGGQRQMQPRPSDAMGHMSKDIHGRIVLSQTTQHNNTDYVKLMVQTDSGTRTALVGPKSVLDRQNVQLRQGETVQLSGAVQDVGGEQVLVADRLQVSIELSQPYSQQLQQGGQKSGPEQE